MSTLQAFILADVCDLEDRGMEAVLDRLQNDVGVSGLTVYADPPPRVQLRPGAVDGPRVFRSAGGLLIRPEGDRFAATRLKPIVAAEARGRTTFAKLARSCSDRELALRVHVSGCHHPRAAARHPDMAAKDALGHTSTQWLCPHNPDVETYLYALVDDLCAGRVLDAVVLGPLYQRKADLLSYTEVGIALAAGEKFLLSLCFCESSQQKAAAADVEIRGLAALSRQLLRTRLQDSPAACLDLGHLLQKYPAFRRFQEWRRREATRIAASLGRRIRTTLVLEQDDAFAVGDIPGSRLLLPCLESKPESVETAIREARREIGAADRIELQFDLQPGLLGDSQALVSVTSRAAELGVTHLSFGHLPLWADAHFDWIKKALRNARRVLASA